ncbi:hypothetical protein SEA_SATIS_238 [Streptomyces phage Satis]|nr:hypothetical protein SEA_SATIS_238 [Streptomyces phage Satis]QBZ72125.1 hypothetical protein SEA_KRADAL_239 [Streptomyces phage Kradal]QPL14546.1 hypothetical protein SEA_EHYELIMAYOE_241 [Streptomyces phage EhyElimayoE]
MYTLVRHNMWTIEQFPQFHRGLEPLLVGTFTAQRIRQYGGVLFSSEDEAWDAAEGFMYPTGDKKVPANPNGSFADVFFLRHQLFVPVFSGDLIAA